MMTLKYPAPQCNDLLSHTLFTLPLQGEPTVTRLTQRHLSRLRENIRLRIPGPLTLTCHPHRVGATNSVSLTLEGALKQRISILITVAGQVSWPDDEEYHHPRWYITVPDAVDLVYLVMWVGDECEKQKVRL
ncbi:acetyltransferase [Erwinia mallotivora]|uniref:acetyltransferase n=1 Tax=Erwinia mallotivora TaxID=69222 RepID=UPI0021BE1B57|nr:acetyltransferase [Erwinia mallotivora]